MRVIETSPDDTLTAELLRAYFAERVGGFTEGAYRVSAPDPAQFTPPGVFLRIDEDDGAPLACGGLREIEPADDGRRMEVKHLFVAPAARGSGIGRRLITRLEAHARSEGAAWLVLDTNRSLVAAAGLYATSGFLPVPAFNDNPNATDWYAKRLVPSPA
ncbi:GNAT family N-acetyltransferase [uncultured Amnibacterium sp.]|uniref:GNAT family N-acetyltransferase n=1 Tax=uncultured Amnibacterium sp. TaxID=1631851 RepID=UPI0035CAF4D8